MFIKHYFTVAVQCLTCETILINQYKKTPLHILENIIFPSIRADLASVQSCSHTLIYWKGRVFSVSIFFYKVF